MKKLLVIIPMLALSLSACIPSLHPLYTKETLTYREDLIGKWVDQDDALWNFEKAEDQSYRLTIDHEDGQESYEVHLVRLNDLLFIDFFPADHSEEQPYSLTWLVPTHSFGKVEIIGQDHFQLKFFDNEWLEELFLQRKIRIKNERLDDGTIVLSAGPEELQQFVIKYAGEPQAYVDPLELNRQP